MSDKQEDPKEVITVWYSDEFSCHIFRGKHREKNAQDFIGQLISGQGADAKDIEVFKSTPVRMDIEKPQVIVSFKDL